MFITHCNDAAFNRKLLKFFVKIFEPLAALTVKLVSAISILELTNSSKLFRKLPAYKSRSANSWSETVVITSADKEGHAVSFLWGIFGNYDLSRAPLNLILIAATPKENWVAAALSKHLEGKLEHLMTICIDIFTLVIVISFKNFLGSSFRFFLIFGGFPFFVCEVNPIWVFGWGVKILQLDRKVIFIFLWRICFIPQLNIEHKFRWHWACTPTILFGKEISASLQIDLAFFCGEFFFVQGCRGTNTSIVFNPFARMLPILGYKGIRLKMFAYILKIEVELVPWLVLFSI